MIGNQYYARERGKTWVHQASMPSMRPCSQSGTSFPEMTSITTLMKIWCLESSFFSSKTQQCGWQDVCKTYKTRSKNKLLIKWVCWWYTAIHFNVLQSAKQTLGTFKLAAYQTLSLVIGDVLAIIWCFEYLDVLSSL